MEPAVGHWEGSAPAEMYAGSLFTFFVHSGSSWECGNQKGLSGSDTTLELDKGLHE